MTYTLGVDLGTTTSAAAVLRDGTLEPCELGESSLTVPSVVLPRDDGRTLIGDAAALHGGLHAVREARRWEPDPAGTAGTAGSPEPHRAMGLLLDTIVDQVAAAEGGRPDRVVLVEPAAHARSADRPYVQVAADFAGEAPLVPAPVAAAAILDLHRGLEPGTTVGVLDLGDESCEATLVRRTATGFDVVGRPGSTAGLGGFEVDTVVLEHIDAALDNAVSRLDPGTGDDASALDRLRAGCRRAREQLLRADDAVVEVGLPRMTARVRLTRGELQRLVRPHMAEAVATMEWTIADAGLEPEDLEAIVLVGGSARLPVAAETACERLGRPVVIDSIPELTGALGAALVGSPDGAPAARAPAPETAGPPLSALGLGPVGEGLDPAGPPDGSVPADTWIANVADPFGPAPGPSRPGEVDDSGDNGDNGDHRPTDAAGLPDTPPPAEVEGGGAPWAGAGVAASVGEGFVGTDWVSDSKGAGAQVGEATDGGSRNGAARYAGRMEVIRYVGGTEGDGTRSTAGADDHGDDPGDGPGSPAVTGRFRARAAEGRAAAVAAAAAVTGRRRGAARRSIAHRRPGDGQPAHRAPAPRRRGAHARRGPAGDPTAGEDATTAIAPAAIAPAAEVGGAADRIDRRVVAASLTLLAMVLLGGMLLVSSGGEDEQVPPTDDVQTSESVDGLPVVGESDPAEPTSIGSADRSGGAEPSPSTTGERDGTGGRGGMGGDDAPGEDRGTTSTAPSGRSPDGSGTGGDTGAGADDGAAGGPAGTPGGRTPGHGGGAPGSAPGPAPSAPPPTEAPPRPSPPTSGRPAPPPTAPPRAPAPLAGPVVDIIESLMDVIEM